MKEEPLSLPPKCEQLLSKCCQLESENALLAYKLRKLNKLEKRLIHDNAFIQRRLKEHVQSGHEPKQQSRKLNGHVGSDWKDIKGVGT